jgi:hypothetical protein
MKNDHYYNGRVLYTANGPVADRRRRRPARRGPSLAEYALAGAAVVLMVLLLAKCLV